MTKEKKAKIDALLLMGAYINTSEAIHPIRTSLAGCPNMAADGWCVPMQMAFLFPEHPMAEYWKDYYEKTWDISSKYFTRPEVKTYKSKGGRWTESLGTYHWAHLAPTSYSLAGIKNDGKNRWANELFRQRAQWLIGNTTAPLWNPDPYWRQNYRIVDPTSKAPKRSQIF